jgi:hypothetical protein
MQAFPTPEDLEMLLAESLGRSLAAIAPTGRRYDYVVFCVIRAAEAEGWIAELILAACAARPSNPELAAVAEIVSLAAAGGEAQLERMVRPTAGIQDAERWREELRRNERRVCRIEGKTAKLGVTGTGFLVGPDLLLTNFHVVEPLLLNEGGSKLCARFDLRLSPNGVTLLEGTTYALAADWLVASSPHPAAKQASVEAAGDDPAWLDYALLRLADPVGEQEIGLGGGEPRRGWVALNAGLRVPEVDDQVLILQHPADAALQVAIDRVVSLDAQRAIVRYLTNTEDGSSGAPCFGPRWELLALHEGGSAGAASNQGIAAAAIARHVIAKLGSSVLPPTPEGA